LATGTEPLVAVLCPIALIRIVIMRTDLRQQASVIGLGLGIVYQAIGVIEAGNNSSAFATASANGALPAFGVRVGWGWLTGNDLSNHLLHSSHVVIWQIAGYFLLAAIVGFGLLLRDRATSIFAITAIVFAGITFFVPVIVRGVGSGLVVLPIFAGSRYSATPVLLVLSALLVIATRVSFVHKQSVVRFAPMLICLVLLAPVWVLDLRTANDRSGGPEWSQELSAAVANCKSHPNATANLVESPPNWIIKLPCQDIS
jgi:hypothetical protein